MAVSDILVQLKNTVLGVKSNDIDNIIDNSLDQISKYSSNNDNNKFIDAFKNIIKVTNTTDNSFLKSLDNGNPQVQTYDQSGRVGRYQEYDAICSKIPYCQRALETWVDHIVSPDDILKTTLEIIVPDDEENDNEKLNRTRKRIQTLIEHFDLENKTKNIVRTTLKKGDNFIELVLTKNGRNTLVVLNESEQKKYDFVRKKYKYDDGDEKKTVNIVVESGSQLINFGGPFVGLGTLISSPNYPNLMRNQQDISGIPEWSKDSSKSMSNPPDPSEKKKQFKGRYDDETKEEIDNKKKENDELVALNDISIVIHDPKYVIRLETQRYRVCLGYLVFPKVDIAQIVSGGVTNNIDSLCVQLLSDIKMRLGLKEFSDSIDVGDDIKKVLSAHLSKITKNEDLKIRYVSPNLMQHFRLDTSKYYPYGESIFDCVLFQCRLYMALQTALTTKRINACSDKRFINIEMGLPRDAAQLVERMKDAITKKKISVGSLGNIDTIPSQISTFETIYLPQKDGKKFIEIDHQQWGGDPSSDADQLKQMRDGIIGNLGVPAAYLNIEENCLPYDTKISLLDGSNIEIGKIVNLWEENEKNRNIWVYSIDPETKNIVPGKITQVFRTRKNAQLVRVHLDNGEYVDATPDHKFMLRDGTYIEAQYLKENDSLMPLYKRNTSYKVRVGTPYEEIYQPSEEIWKLTHRVVAESVCDIPAGYHVHHINRNPKNNHPDNLLVCSPKDHMELHGYLSNKDNNGNILYEKNTSLIEKRNCIICGKEFECSVQSNRNTCKSEECTRQRRIRDGYKSWERARKLNPELERIDAVCFVCGKKIKVTPSSYKLQKKNSYGLHSCSKECAAKLAGFIHTMHSMDKNNLRKEKCEICGKEFIMDDNRATKTCSIKCMNTVLSRRRWKGHSIETKCQLCGRPIVKSLWDIKAVKTVVCDDPKCHRASFGCSRWLVKNPDKTIEDYAKLKGIIPYSENKEYKNHKVVRVEWLEEKKDCYDIEVNKYHNFAVSAGVFVHNSSNRSILTTESINFCRSIISKQQDLSVPLWEFFYKAFILIWGKQEADLLRNIKITFQTPKISPAEHFNEVLQNTAAVISSLTDLGVPREYLKRKFLPYIDWDEVENYITKEKLSQEVGDQTTSDNGMMGGMGGLGMGSGLGGGMDMGGMGGMGGGMM